MASKGSLPPAYFEDMFRGTPDPWGFETKPYERDKYEHTLRALADRQYARGFEVGCANGVLTQRLAAYCSDLLAVDVSETALSSARKRCGNLAHVRFALLTYPTGLSSIETCDLIVLSEVVYYWSDDDIASAGRDISQRLQMGGDLVLVHWTGETDYPQTGDGAVHKLREALGTTIEVHNQDRKAEYRLDLWRRR